MSVTHGGEIRGKRFDWHFDANSKEVHIYTENRKKLHAYSTQEIQAILSGLYNEFGNEDFPLANNVMLLGNGTEKMGLGVIILQQENSDVHHAQGASYLGVVLEECRYLDWNGKHYGIQWRLRDDTDYNLDSIQSRLIRFSTSSVTMTPHNINIQGRSMESNKIALDKVFAYNKFPEYYMTYVWSGKHTLFGYPPDTFPDFLWITSLEKRFAWVVRNYSVNNSASKYLLQEMIEWGGSQNGILQKFNDRCGEVNLFILLQDVINNLSDPDRAISSALCLPGLGLTYASKLLRFMQPEMYGALDSTIRNELHSKGILPRIYDGIFDSMKSGYVTFVGVLQDIKEELKTQGIKKPVPDDGAWRSSEIEMALFCWAASV